MAVETRSPRADPASHRACPSLRCARARLPMGSGWRRKGARMFCVTVIATADGGSQFGGVDIEQHEGPYAVNVPPVLVSQPLPVGALVVVTMPDDVNTTVP